MMPNLLEIAFQSVMGPVETGNIWDSLWLMLKGMGGILLVMLLIFLVIVLLNRLFNKKDGDPGQEEKK